MQYRLSHSLMLSLILISPLATADSAQSRRIAKYAPICKDLDRANYEVECFRPPAGYQYLYEMDNAKRAQYMKQARRTVEVRRNADRYRDKKRYR